MKQIARVACIALAIAGGAAGGCRGCGEARQSRLLGNVAPVDGVDFAPYLAAAHAIVTGGARPANAPPERPGQRVFVTAWVAKQPPVRGTGLGATLLDSVVAASQQVSVPAGATGVRVEIDVLTSAEPATLEAKIHDRVFDVGLHGYLAGNDVQRFGWVLPRELVDEHEIDLTERKQTLELRGEKVIAKVAARARVDPVEIPSMNAWRFKVSEWIEPATAGAPPIALFRGAPPRPADLTPDALVAAVRSGAEYLARVTDAHGMFTYQYNPVTDQKERGYGILRHCGSTYALLEAYEELRVPEWLDKARLLLATVKGKLTATPDGSYLTDNADEEQQKVGGNGLALLAFVKYAQVSGDTSDLPTMRELGRYILHQQYPDGHFRDNADVAREDQSQHGKKLKKEVPYFPGEASLGLLRLQALDPQPQWVAGAKKGLDFLIDVRDRNDDLKTQNHDHWQSYALHDLYVLTREQRYFDQAVKIARAIELGEKKGESAPYPDYVGAFYDEGETTPTSTRLEALASTMQLHRFAKVDGAWLEPLASQLASLMRGQQIDAASGFFARDLAKSMGGVRESLMNDDVRIDYVQHAMSAWLRLARLRRDPAFGAP
ncbi:MAG TPA: hypothetical protein VGI39_14065 [Polyangiaceae bacterium]